VTGGPGELAAVVAAGGRASRLGGVDKLALDVGGLTVLDRVLLAATGAGALVAVVGPPRPTAVAPAVTVAEARPGGGPVPAVAAGLAALDDLGAEPAVVLTLAGDLPMLTAAVLHQLVMALGAAPGATAAAATRPGGGLEPLVAAHRGPALRARLAGRGPGTPAGALLGPGTVGVAVDPEALVNLNGPDDLARLTAATQRAARRPGPDGGISAGARGSAG